MRWRNGQMAGQSSGVASRTSMGTSMHTLRPPMDDSPARAPFLRPAIAAAAVGALVLRVAYILGWKLDQPLRGDAVYYSWQAELLADGKGFVRPRFGGPAADHPPLTSLAMTPFAWATDSLTTRRLAMAVIGVAVVIACAYLGHLLAGPRAGAIAGVIAAVYPNLWMNDALIMSDTLTALFVALFLVAIYRWHERPSVRNAGLVGLAAGLGTLTRAEMPLVAPFVMVTIVAAAFYGITRFRVPAEVSIVVLAAVAVDRWLPSVATQSTDVPTGIAARPSRVRSASVSPIAARSIIGDV